MKFKLFRMSFNKGTLEIFLFRVYKIFINFLIFINLKTFVDRNYNKH